MIKDLAPNITRQRLLIEGKYTTEISVPIIKDYLLQLAKSLDLRTYGEPIIHSPSGQGKAENQGYDAFVPLIDSGIALYVWTSEKFFSCVLYTCKEFSTDKAVAFTKEFFKTVELEYEEF